MSSIAQRVDAALQETPMPPTPAETSESMEKDPLYEGSVALRLLDGAIDAAEDAVAAQAEAPSTGADAEAEAAEALQRLEVQVWLELDAMLQAIRE